MIAKDPGMRPGLGVFSYPGAVTHHQLRRQRQERGGDCGVWVVLGLCGEVGECGGGCDEGAENGGRGGGAWVTVSALRGYGCASQKAVMDCPYNANNSRVMRTRRQLFGLGGKRKPEC